MHQSHAQMIFDQVIKEGFQDSLKPLRYKKKANNFYLPLEGLGHIINVQKSKYSTKDEIRFTINCGIFEPKYWNKVYNYTNMQIPSFPTEPECCVRYRIGQIRNMEDLWYDIDDMTNIHFLINEMRFNIQEFILPFFNQASSLDKFIDVLDTSFEGLSDISKIIVFGEHAHYYKAQNLYDKLKTNKLNPSSIQALKEIGLKYSLKD